MMLGTVHWIVCVARFHPVNVQGFAIPSAGCFRQYQYLTISEHTCKRYLHVGTRCDSAKICARDGGRNAARRGAVRGRDRVHDGT